MPQETPPVVLVIAGHDPSGGAGIQADIETVNAMGCYPATAVTTLTVQDSRNIHDMFPVPPGLLRQQALSIINDYPIAAIKVGLLGSVDNALTLVKLLKQFPRIPLILDTVLAAGGGRELSSRTLLEVILSELVPRAQLVTPNSVEARRLTQQSKLDECAGVLLRAGAKAVLVTGEHEGEEVIVNTLYRTGCDPMPSTWDRIPGQYHGSGCTLASAAAAALARGFNLEEAVLQAQEYTWQSLKSALTPGQGQMIPNRCRDRRGM